MPRLGHGQIMKLANLDGAAAALASHNPEMRIAFARPLRDQLQPFDLLFDDLQDPDDLLPESSQTVQAIQELAAAMSEPHAEPDKGRSKIPAAYTYFGQFIDHDITLEATDATAITSPNLTPLPRPSIPLNTKNQRTSALDLDSVYGQGPTSDPDALVPYNGNRLQIGTVTALNLPGPPTGRPPGKDDFNDLPREGRSIIDETDRAARIGDPRNDENTIVAQLHLAFLRAHNRLIDEGNGFRKAQRILRQHYQHIVIHDYLRKRVADPAIVDGILQNGNTVYKPNQHRFMPVEFSFAAYRFGHSMVRNAYDFNLNFNLSGNPGTIPATFERLFTFTALSGQLGDFDTLPENWIIEWENLIGTAQAGGVARRIDTAIAPELFKLRDVTGQPLSDPSPLTTQIMRHLAIRNLLRGYLFRVPTGQAVAGKLGIAPLTAAEFQQAVTPDELGVLNNRGLLNRTPLWYYVLAEAAARENGERLGPVGSTIVAEVLIGLVRRSDNSILKGNKTWKPTLPSAQPNTFELSDLLRFAGVLP